MQNVFVIYYFSERSPETNLKTLYKFDSKDRHKAKVQWLRP